MQKHLPLLAQSINFVDVSGADLLAEEAATRRAQGGGLYLHRPRQPAREMLSRGGQLDRIGPGHVFVSMHEAIATVFTRLDDGICRRCTARIFRECATLAPADPGLEAPRPARDTDACLR